MLRGAVEPQTFGLKIVLTCVKVGTVSAPWRHASGGDDMSDDKTMRSPQDASRIALGEDYEVDYWTRTLGVDRAKLASAVAAVGNSADAVRRHLSDRKK